MKRFRFRGLDGRAVAALEFAFLAPTLILLSVGIVEFTAAIRAQMGVDAAAHAVANLIAQQSAVSTAQLNDFFIAGKYSYAFNAGTISISAASVVFSAGTPTGTIAWDAASASGSYAASPSSILSLSSGLGGSTGGVIVGGDSTIVAQAKVTFSMPLALGPINPSYTFTSTAFARPRLGFTITLN